MKVTKQAIPINIKKHSLYIVVTSELICNKFFVDIDASKYLEELLSFCLKDILQRLLHKKCGQCGKSKGNECTKDEHKRILL